MKYKFKIEGEIEVEAENEEKALEQARLEATIEGGWDIINFIPFEFCTCEVCHKKSEDVRFEGISESYICDSCLLKQGEAEK